MFSYMSNSTKYIKITSGVSVFVNPIWPPRWPPKSINGYNFCSMADSSMKVVSKYRFSSMSSSFRYLKITSGMSIWVNKRWSPRWLPKIINGYNFRSMADSSMKVVANIGFQVWAIHLLVDELLILDWDYFNVSTRYMKIISVMSIWANTKWPPWWLPIWPPRFLPK